MARAAVSTGIEIEYETTGDPSNEALLLVMGFTAQLIAWQDDFVQRLADGGRYVIRFDNRDCGLSTKFDGIKVDVAGAMTGAKVDVPYTLSDMSDDGFALLDHLGIETAHILGASMGGMIVQTMAIEHPERVRSMVSVMSTTGEVEYGQAAPEAIATLLSPPPTDRDAYIAASDNSAIWSSKKHHDIQRNREMAARAYDRGFYPDGAQRQLGAIFANGPRGEQLPNVTVPTLVIHGVDDTLITPSGGQRTAALIPGAHLLMVADMGHDLPPPLVPFITDVVLAHTRAAG